MIPATDFISEFNGVYMRYVKDLPKGDVQLSQQLLNDGWAKIKEPKNLLVATVLSFPMAVMLTVFTSCLAYLLKPELFEFITSDTLEITIQINWRLFLLIPGIFFYMLVHEMIHALCIPNFMKSEKVVWGLNGLFGFVSSSEPIKKERFLIISFMPFLILSVLALLVLNALGILNGYTFMLCLVNSAGSCVDFLNMIIIYTQVKRRHTIICNGFETFWDTVNLN